VVYLGRHPLIGKEVAIKVLRLDAAENADHARRMLKEAQSVNAIRHRAIVDIFGFGQLPDGRHYLAMEYLQGEPLGQWFRRTFPAPLEQVLELLEALCSALQAAHGARVIHRDLKPGNVFVHEDEQGRLEIKLLDFGLAKQVSEKTTGRTLGTPNYMAPEQIHLRADVSPQTDLYSLGVLAYELFTGDLPFGTKADIGSILRAHLEESPRPPSELRPELPREIEQLLLALLDKDPAHRPSSAEEVRQRLRTLREQPAAPRPVQAPSPAGSSRKSSPVPADRPPQAPDRDFPWKALVTGGVLVAAGTAGVLAWLEQGEDAPAPQQAAPGVSAQVAPAEPSPAPTAPAPRPAPRPGPAANAAPRTPTAPAAAEIWDVDALPAPVRAPAVQGPPPVVGAPARRDPGAKDPSGAPPSPRPAAASPTPAQMMARLESLEARVDADDEAAQSMLVVARTKARAASTPAQREAVVRLLDEFEKKYLP